MDYHFKVASSDAAGNQGVTNDSVFRVAPPIMVGVKAFGGDEKWQWCGRPAPCKTCKAIMCTAHKALTVVL